MTSNRKKIVRLRDVETDDLLVFFEQQRDEVAWKMAAFESRDYDAFMEHWGRILLDDSANIQTIVYNGQTAGHVAAFEREGKTEIGYWVGREHWGRGIATTALTEFLRREARRPLYACVAADNLGSIRVVEKCGFVVASRERFMSRARGGEIDEVILRLDEPLARRRNPA